MLFGFLSFCRKFPDIFSQFKSLLGIKEPSTAEVSPEGTPPPQIPLKERVTEFAAEIGTVITEHFLNVSPLC